VLLSASSVVYNDCRWNRGCVQQSILIFGGLCVCLEFIMIFGGIEVMFCSLLRLSVEFRS
jgi:hypothetical protein